MFRLVDQKLQKKIMGVNVLEHGLVRAVEIAGAGTDEGSKIVIATPVPLNQNLTIPSGVYLHFTNEGKINVQSGFTLTVNGTIFSEGGEDFIGNGTIDISNANIISRDSDVSVFGAVGDGVTDDTEALQNAIDNASVTNGIVKLKENSTYMVDAEVSLQMKSNTSLYIPPTTVIKCIPNDKQTYEIIQIHDVDNVKIIGSGVILGDRETHIVSEESIDDGGILSDVDFVGEWGMGISIRGSSNYVIDGITIKDCIGDGIYIADTATNAYCENGVVSNVTCDYNRRQGISVVSAVNLIIKDSKLINTLGTAPQAGIDLEPNDSGDFLDNVVLDNVYTENNAGGGFKVHLQEVANDLRDYNISINNCYDAGGGDYNLKFLCYTDNEINGYLNINNFFGRDSKKGFTIQGAPENLKIRMNDIKILNSNTDGNNDSVESSPITVYRSTADTSTNTYSDIVIDGLDIEGNLSKRIISIVDDNGLGFGDVKIKGVNNLGTPVNSYVYLSNCPTVNLSIEENKNILTKGWSGTYSLLATDLYTKYNSTATGTATIPTTIPVGTRIKFVNTATVTIYIEATSCNILPLQTTAGNYITTSEKYASVELEKVSATSYRIVNLVGTWTAE